MAILDRVGSYGLNVPGASICVLTTNFVATESIETTLQASSRVGRKDMSAKGIAYYSELSAFRLSTNSTTVKENYLFNMFMLFFKTLNEKLYDLNKIRDIAEKRVFSVAGLSLAERIAIVEQEFLPADVTEEEKIEIIKVLYSENVLGDKTQADEIIDRFLDCVRIYMNRDMLDDDFPELREERDLLKVCNFFATCFSRTEENLNFDKFSEWLNIKSTTGPTYNLVKNHCRYVISSILKIRSNKVLNKKEQAKYRKEHKHDQ